MEDKMLDHQLTETFQRATGDSVKLKDQVWECIEKRLDGIDSKVAKTRKISSRYRQIIIAAASTAAVIAVVFFAGTPIGQAAVKKVVNMMLPQKEIVQEIEGNKEKTRVDLSTNKAGYAIYIDRSIYKTETVEGKERILPVNKPDANIPEVYMEISQVTDKTPLQLADELANELKSQGFETTNHGIVEKPVKCALITAADGNKWNSTVVHYYLIDNKKSGTFVVKQKYFMEASEGHGARFDNMLAEFKILE